MEGSTVKKEIEGTSSDCMVNLPQEGDCSLAKETVDSINNSSLNISSLANISNLEIVKQEIDESSDMENISNLDSSFVIDANPYELADNQVSQLTPIIISATSLSNQNDTMKNDPENLQIIQNESHQIDNNFEIKIKSEPKDDRESLVVEGFVMPLEVDISNAADSVAKKTTPSKRGRRKKVITPDIQRLAVVSVDSNEVQQESDDVEKEFNPLEEMYETTNFLGMGRIKCLLCKSIVSSSSFRCHLRTHCKYFPYQCGFCAFTATGRSLIEQHIKFKHRTVDFKILLTPNMEQQKEAYLLLLRDNKFPVDATKPISIHSRSRIIQTKTPIKPIQIANSNSVTTSSNIQNNVTTEVVSAKSLSQETNQSSILSNTDSQHNINNSLISSTEINLTDKSKSNDNVVGNTEQFICTICGQHFGNRGALGIHVKYEIQRLPYSCKSCAFRCRTAKELENHNTLKKHAEATVPVVPKPVNSSVVCQICKGIYSPETIGKHMKNHEERESYQCSYCSFTCQGKNILKDHMTKNHPGKPICMVKLATKSTIRCQICKVNCSTQASLNVHVKTTHWKRECFCCGHCGFKSENRAVVVQHNKDQHPNCTASVKVKYKQKDRVIKQTADSEEETNYNENSGDDNSSDDENIPVPVYGCYDKEIENVDELDTLFNYISRDENSAKLSDKENIVDHDISADLPSTNSHSISQSSASCPLCHKKFPSSNIMTHLDSHLYQKFFQCIYCNYKADDRAITKSHIKQTHPNKPLFTISINMGVQMLNTAKEQVERESLNDIENGNKLNCRLCPKKFDDIPDLSKHYKNSHGHVCCFFCTYCFTNLKSRDFILLHIYNEHKGKEFKFKAKYTLPVNMDSDGNPKSRSPVYVYDASESEEAMNLLSNVRETANRKEAASGLKNLNPLVKTIARPLSTTDKGTSNSENSDQKEVEISGSHYIKPGCCPLCGKEVDKNNIIRHMKIHFHMFKYQCKYCNFQKQEAYEVKRHIIYKHKPKPVAIIEMTSNSIGNKESQMKKYVDWFMSFNQDISNDKSSSSKTNRYSTAKAALEKLQPPNNYIILKPLQSGQSLQAFRESDRLQCPACSFECVSQDLFNKHKRQHTFTETLYCCEYCNFKDYSEPRVIAHIEKFHAEEEIDIREILQIQVMVGENAGDITYQTVYTDCPKKIELNPVIKLVDCADSLPYLMSKQNENEDHEDETEEMDDVVEVKDDEIYQITEIWNKPKPSQVAVKIEIDDDSEIMDISENDYSAAVKKEVKDENVGNMKIKQEVIEEMEIDDQPAENENCVEKAVVIKQEVDLS